MTNFALPLLVIVQADDEAEARELRDAASAALATNCELHASVLSVQAGEPCPVADPQVPA